MLKMKLPLVGLGNGSMGNVLAVHEGQIWEASDRHKSLTSYCLREQDGPGLMHAFNLSTWRVEEEGVCSKLQASQSCTV